MIKNKPIKGICISFLSLLIVLRFTLPTIAGLDEYVLTAAVIYCLGFVFVSLFLKTENEKHQKIEQKILQNVKDFATQVIFHDITILEHKLEGVIDKKQWAPLHKLREKLRKEPTWENINELNKELRKVIGELKKKERDVIADKYTKEMYKSLIYNYHIWLKIFEITYYQFDFCR